MEPRELYDRLYKAQMYTKSYEEFKKQYASSDAAIASLHSKVSELKAYDGDLASFRAKFFAPEPSKKNSGSKPLPAGSPDTSSPQPTVVIAEDPYSAGGLIPEAQPVVGVKAPPLSADPFGAGGIIPKQAPVVGVKAPPASSDPIGAGGLIPEKPSPEPQVQQPVVKGPIKIDWEKGKATKLTPFEMVRDSMVQSIEAQQAYDKMSNNPDGTKKEVDYSAKDYFNTAISSINKGVIGDGFGGLLKGAGEYAIMANPFYPPGTVPEDNWLWQAGDALQGMFEKGGIAEPPVPKELMDSTLGQAGSALGQVLMMIMTGGASAEATVATKLPSATNLLTTAAGQLFSRPATIGAFQMLADEAESIRTDKAVVDSMPKEEYITRFAAEGKDPELLDRKWTKLSTSDPEDLIAQMLPGIIASGATEAIPVAGWFHRMNKATGGSMTKTFVKKLGDVAVGTVEGAAQEALQEWMSNASARQIYDYTRSSTEGLEQSAKVGGGSQFVLELIGAALGVKAGKLSGKDKELVESAISEIEKKKETLARNLENTVAVSTSVEDLKNTVGPMVENGTMTQEEADAILSAHASKKAAMEAVPEELRGNPDVVEEVAKKQAIMAQIKAKKQAADKLDSSFTRPIEFEIIGLENEAAKASVKIAEMTGTEPNQKDLATIEKANEDVVSVEGEPAKVQDNPPIDAPAEPIAEQSTEVPVTPDQLVPGQVYFSPEANRSFTYVGKGKDGMHEFIRMQRDPSEVLMSTRMKALEDAMFMKGLVAPKQPIAQPAPQPVVPVEPVTATQPASPVVPQPAEPASIATPQPAEPASQSTPQPVDPTTATEQQSAQPPVIPPTEPPVSPERPQIGGTGETKRSRFESDEGSMAKAEALGTKDKSFREATDLNPATYEVLDMHSAAEQAGQEIQERGATVIANELADRATAVKDNLDMGDQTRRMAVIVALNRQLKAELAAGDPNAKATMDLISRTNNDLSTLSSKYGQENAQLRMWQASPDGILSSAVAKVAKANKVARAAIGESGKSVDQEIKAFVEDLKSIGVTEQEIADAVKSAIGKGEWSKTGRQKAAEGRRELNTALTKLRKAVGGQMSSIAPFASREAMAALVDVFRAAAKITAGKSQTIKERFVTEIDKMLGSGGDAAWDAISQKYPQLVANAENKDYATLLANMEKAKQKAADQMAKEMKEATENAERLANEVIVNKATKEAEASIAKVDSDHKKAAKDAEMLQKAKEDARRKMESERKKAADEAAKSSQSAVANKALKDAKESFAKAEAAHKEARAMAEEAQKEAIRLQEALQKARDNAQKQLESDRDKAMKRAEDHAKKVARQKYENEVRNINAAKKAMSKRALSDIDPQMLEDLMTKKMAAGDAMSPSLVNDIMDEFGVSEPDAMRIRDEVLAELRTKITKSRVQAVAGMVKQHKPRVAPVQRRTMEDKLLRAIALGGLESDAMARQVAQFYDVREFTPEEIQMFGEVVSGAKDLPGNKLARERMSEVLDYIKTDIEGVSGAEIAVASLFANVLSGVKTQVVNVYGNVEKLSDIAMRISADGMIAMSNKLKSDKAEQGGSTAGLRNVAREAWGVRLEALRIMTHGRASRDYDKMSSSPLLEMLSKRGFGRGAKADITTAYAKAARYVSRTMRMADAFFYGAHNSFVRGQQAYRQALAEGYSGSAAETRATEILGGAREQMFATARQELIDSKQPYSERDVAIRAYEIMQDESSLEDQRAARAKDIAERNTFINRPFGIAGHLSESLTGFTFRMFPSDSAPKGVADSVMYYFSRSLFMFANTTANIFNSKADYIPLVGGALRVAESHAYKEGKNTLAIPHFRNIDETYTLVAKQIAGVGLMGTVLALLDWDDKEEANASRIKITSSFMGNYNLARQAKETGEEPMSITWTTKDGEKRSMLYKDWSIAPALNIVGAMMDAHRFGKPDDVAENAVFGIAAASMMAMFTEETAMRQLADVTSYMENGNFDRIMSMMTRPIGGLLKPGMGRHIADLIDPTKREVYDAGNTWYEELAYHMASNVIALDKFVLREKFNVLGDPVKDDDVALYRGVGADAVIKRRRNPDPIISTFLRNGVIIPDVKKQPLAGQEMDDDQYYAFVLGAVRLRKHLLESADVSKMTAAEMDKFVKGLSSTINMFGKSLAIDPAFTKKMPLAELTKKVDAIIASEDYEKYIEEYQNFLEKDLEE